MKAFCEKYFQRNCENKKSNHKETLQKVVIMNETKEVPIKEIDYFDGLTCYTKRDLEPMVKFLFHFSTYMQHIVIAVAILGTILNLTGIYILSSRQSMKNTFNQLLVTLYCIDSLFLCAYVYLSLSLTYIKSQHISVIITSRFIKLFYSFAFKCSIFLTVAISHERYVAMLHPSLHFSYMSTLSNQRKRLMKYLIPIMTVAAILNVPEYLEHEFVWKESSIEERNDTWTDR